MHIDKVGFHYIIGSNRVLTQEIEAPIEGLLGSAQAPYEDYRTRAVALLPKAKRNKGLSPNQKIKAQSWVFGTRYNRSGHENLRKKTSLLYNSRNH
jgi:hypothetical protein